MFRESALKGMIAAGTYTKERVECIHNLQVKEDKKKTKYSKEIVKKYTTQDQFDTDLDLVKEAVSVAESLVIANMEAISG